MKSRDLPFAINVVLKYLFDVIYAHIFFLTLRGVEGGGGGYGGRQHTGFLCSAKMGVSCDNVTNMVTVRSCSPSVH